MINLTAIRNQASSQSYTRGNTIYKHGMVENFHISREGPYTIVDACVEGSYANYYEVHVTYDEERDEFYDYDCECPAFQTYEGMCKHCVAVALELLDQKGKKIHSDFQGRTVDKIRNTDYIISTLIYQTSIPKKARYFQPDQAGKVELAPLVHVSGRMWSVDFKIGAGTMYVLKNISEFTEAVKAHSWKEYGKKLAFFHDRNIFTEKSRKLVDFLTECVELDKEAAEGYFSQIYQRYDSKIGRYLLLTPEKMVGFAQAMCGEDLMVDFMDSRGRDMPRQVRIVEEDPVFSVVMKEETDGGCLITIPGAWVFRGTRRMCILTGSYLYLCSETFTAEMGDFCVLMDPVAKKSAYVSKEDLPAFCGSVVPVLDEHTVLKKPEGLKKYEPKPCMPQIYLDTTEGSLTARLYAGYGDSLYDLTEELEIKDLHRDIEKEQNVYQTAAKYFGHCDPVKHILFIEKHEEESIYRLLSTGIGQLQQLGEVFISDALKRMRILRAPKVSVGVSLKAGLLDITLLSERLPSQELEALLTSYRRRKKYYRLKNGDFIELGDNSLSAVAELAEGLELDAKDLADGHIQVPEYRSFYLDSVLRDNEEGINVKRDQTFKAFLRSMKNVEDSDYEVPVSLKAELRPYQRFGYRWLMTLDQLGFGGILADDMGLGKTVQAVAYLLAKKDAHGNQSRPGTDESRGYAGCGNPDHGYRSLIVCPASLVYNWESEINRFAPSLSVETVTGTIQQRRKVIESTKADVLLTSYDLLKRDIEEYEKQYFDCMILDEAQNIKNHTTQAAKAVKSVACGRRFALTGTPIENSLSELWSIFDYLMPGSLGTYKKFKDNYEQPISMKRDEVASARLKKMVRPFILRRLKKDVLKELPDKIEEVIYSLMEDTQRQLYSASAQRLLDSLAKQTPEEFKTGKLQVLSELTRLRQLCCDPSLVYENYNGGAAKVDTCMELIKNAVDAGNRLLLFSQFTSMLDILKERLEKEKIEYYILTGSTTKEKRMELVNSFNGGTVPVFLISLKAGGTGLNLTAASIVIHFDPWWNQAAQNQATDRAHRIGQRQVVTVYKLIVKDTVEEKILKLQERKADLSDEIMSEGSINAAVGTKEEFMEILENVGRTDDHYK